MWPFTPRRFIRREYSEWQFETYTWLLRNFGGYSRLRKTRLITPSPDFFPDTDLTGHDFFMYIFDRVKVFAGMRNLHCQLIPQDADPGSVRVAPTVTLVNDRHAPCGTFSENKEQGAVITYEPGLEKNPMALVATLAHELGHYLTSRASDDPPAGWEAWELVTDLCAVFFGFGIFLANSSFHFQQFSEGATIGWRSSRQGYLSPESLLFALAIFVSLTESDEELPKQHLKANLVGPYKRAIKSVRAHQASLDMLKSIEEDRKTQQ